jgi:hypothetical protein
MSEPARPVHPVSPGAPVPPATPVTPSSRPERAGAAEEPLRRKLLIGAALLLALASIYAGVFNVGRVAQIVLAAAATMAMVFALTSNNRRRDS